jgi:hypothetical protein
MLLLSGSGRASLMSLWARQVRGVLPVRIKPVVVSRAACPGCTAGSVPGYGQGRRRMRNRRADRSDGVVIRLPGVAESNATFARSRAIVMAFARWSNLPMSRLARRCGVAGSPPTNTILSCWSHTPAACADSFTLETNAPPYVESGDKFATNPRAGVTREGILGRSVQLEILPMPFSSDDADRVQRGTRAHKVAPPARLQVFMSRMLLGPSQGHWPGARRSSRSVSSTPTESCLLPPTTVVELDIDTSFENHRWHHGSARTYADACPEVG